MLVHSWIVFDVWSTLLLFTFCDMAANVEGAEINEDTVGYRLFVNIPREKDVREYLEDRRDIFLAFLGRFSMNYIWQQEPFNLRLHTASTSTYYKIR